MCNHCTRNIIVDCRCLENYIEGTISANELFRSIGRCMDVDNIILMLSELSPQEIKYITDELKVRGIL